MSSRGTASGAFALTAFMWAVAILGAILNHYGLMQDPYAYWGYVFLGLVCCGIAFHLWKRT